MERREVLRKVGLFEGLSDRELDMMLQLTTTKKLKKRTYLCRKGDPGNALFAILEGRLKATGEGRDGKEVVFSVMDPGEVIGEIALFDQQPRSATVQAVEDATVLTLHRRDLIPFLERNPKIAIRLAAVLSKRIRNLTELMEDTVFLGLPSRLAKKLLALAARYGKQTPEGLKIDLKLPQHELGELVGTSRESINKTLRSWGEEGLVHFANGYLTIKDAEKRRAALARVAEADRAAFDARDALVPPGDAICHALFHPGHVLLAARGPVVIDWPDAFSGPAAIDVARTAVFLRYLGATAADAERRTVLADAYLRAYLDRTALPREEVERCVPLVAFTLLRYAPAHPERGALARLAAI